MRRCVLILLALAGCDRVFGLREVPDAPPTFAGCADDTREGFNERAPFPDIAACAGAWSFPGLAADQVPRCGRAAGNTGQNILGTGCAAVDLCAAGWHVCASRLDVLGSLPQGKTCADATIAPNTLFGTAQGYTGPAGECVDGLYNDFVGCGTYGELAPAACAPLDRTSGNMCAILRATNVGGWNCIDDQSEVTTVVKTDPTMGGGVLCCKNPAP